MSKLNVNTQMELLKEARMYLKDVALVNDTSVKQKKDGIVLTEEHIQEWLEVFYDDRIMLNTCNQSRVQR